MHFVTGFVSRYKALDRIDQDRKLMLFQHLGFVHCPIREHCPAFPNCMDALIERILRTRAHRYIDNECSTGSTHINSAQGLTGISILNVVQKVLI